MRSVVVIVLSLLLQLLTFSKWYVYCDIYDDHIWYSERHKHHPHTMHNDEQQQQRRDAPQYLDKKDDNIFDVPISNADPAAQFGSRQHPLQPPAELAGLNTPLHTNKFYENMLLDSRDLASWTHPYNIWWNGNSAMSFSHPGSMTLTFAKRATSYYALPNVQTFQMGALELNAANCHFEVSDLDDFSINAKVVSNQSSKQVLTLPLVYGMGLVTGIYNGGLTPQLISAVGISSFTKTANTNNNPAVNMNKYLVTLNDGNIWVIYSSVELTGSDSTTITANTPSNANAVPDGTVVQLAHIMNAGDDIKYDFTSGRYFTGATVSGEVNKATGQGVYRIQYSVSQGPPGPTMAFAFPHHIQAFTSTMNGRDSGVNLPSNILGKMQGYYTDVLEMQEDVPTYIGFYPWTAINKNIGTNYNEPDNDANYDSATIYDPQLKRKIAQIVSEEVDDFDLSSDSSSMYFSGKALDKLAMVAFTAKYLALNDRVAKEALDKFKQDFATYKNNQQPTPLIYDTTWKGVISQAGLGGNAQADFGNTYYNDHHFHYGYFVHSMAVAGIVDRELSGNDNWINDNKEFINFLVRDVANPTKKDVYFPKFRSFDWFTGHSWAKGLFSAPDGRDEESSSEDYHFAYGMKLWGYLIKDPAMENRGNLMLGVMRRSMNNYFLYNDSNTVMPPEIINNKVSGILLENKVLYSTWFGDVPQYIHGIHMLPITPLSSFIRGPQFVKEEWSEKIAAMVDQVDDAWKGVLMLNKALFDPQSALDFFMQDDFNDDWIDSGQSRAWAIAYCAGVLNMKK